MTYTQAHALDIRGREVSLAIPVTNYNNLAQQETPTDQLIEEGELDLSVAPGSKGYSDRLLGLCNSGAPKPGHIGHRRSEWYSTRAKS